MFLRHRRFRPSKGRHTCGDQSGRWVGRRSEAKAAAERSPARIPGLQGCGAHCDKPQDIGASVVQHRVRRRLRGVGLSVWGQRWRVVHKQRGPRRRQIAAGAGLKSKVAVGSYSCNMDSQKHWTQKHPEKGSIKFACGLFGRSHARTIQHSGLRASAACSRSALQFRLGQSQSHESCALPIELNPCRCTGAAGLEPTTSRLNAQLSPNI